jgi:thioredoxin-related protein
VKNQLVLSDYAMRKPGGIVSVFLPRFAAFTLKMKNWRTRIEVISNVALIICCIVVVVFFVKNYRLRQKQDTKTNPLAMTSLVGHKISLRDQDWARNQQTLLVVLQKGCRFCDESTLFYQRLTRELAERSKTHLVAVLPQSNDESKQYLKEKMIDIQDVKQAAPMSLGIRGTPTLVLVDPTGTVLEQWNGKLPATEEDKVILRLKQ